MIKEGDIPKTELKRVYAEVLRGSCSWQTEDYGNIYVKHLKVWDTENLDEKRENHFNEAKNKGLPTKEEKLKLLIKDDLWDEAKNKEAEELESFITRLNQSKSKLILKSQIDALSQEIDEAVEKLKKIEEEKSQLVGLTAEIFADKKVNDHYVFLTLFKDKELNEPLLSDEEFDELSDGDLAKLIMIYNKTIEN